TRFGSNTLAVAPERTANGETFLAVNSHQPWSGPVAWYEAHVHSAQGWDAAGGLFPGAPLILHGHNRDLGWAFTVNSPDLVDVFVLEMNPDDPNQYRFDGEWLALEVRQAPISVQLFGRFRWTVKQEVLWSVYGPTVRQPHGVYALRFAGYGEVGLVEQWYRMNKATTFDEWLAAMRDGPLPSFNVGYADKTGNIYYLYNALLPMRAAGYDWQQYLPGNTSETLWTDYLPFDELPQVLNPAAGFIQNGNSTPFQTTLGADNPDPADYAAVFGIETGMTNRALRALALLGRDEAITEAAFAAIKYDAGYAADSDVAAFVAALLAAPPPDDPDLRQALALLRDWDLQATPDSEGATIGLLLLYFLYEADVGLTSWKLVGNEVSAEALLPALEQAVAHLQTHFGRIDVPWGEVNRLRRGDVDVALGGGPDALHAIYGSFDEDGRLHAFSGDAYVMLVTWDAAGQVHSRSIHQFGSATLDAASPHYADQAPLFATQTLKPVWLDEADIRANLSRVYRPGEED
ncbi:MAG: penicillin acylase family protein, partial [Anaerolineales bacterium]|nr:penicillin acylase family protein [Anaerolineales bacterium]